MTAGRRPREATTAGRKEVAAAGEPGLSAPAARVQHPVSDLGASHHAVYRLAPGLLLVFKPRGHREAEHVHEHRQRLRVLRGRLEVRTARHSVTLGGGDAPFTLAPGRRHATEALDDTWLIAEAVSPPQRV